MLTPARPSASDAESPAWASRCVAELTKGRDLAAKTYPAFKKKFVSPNHRKDGLVSVSVSDEDVMAMAQMGTLDAATTEHAAWIDVESAKQHRQGHWFWQRTYAKGEGSVTFDGDPAQHARVEKAMGVLRKAIDACFAEGM